MAEPVQRKSDSFSLSSWEGKKRATTNPLLDPVKDNVQWVNERHPPQPPASGHRYPSPALPAMHTKGEVRSLSTMGCEAEHGFFYNGKWNGRFERRSKFSGC